MVSAFRYTSAVEAKQVAVYLAEEQPILREAYWSLLTHPSLDVVGISEHTESDSLLRVIPSLRPGVMLLGIKTLRPTTVETLEMIRESCPEVGIVLLSAHYDEGGIEALREFSRGASAGYAYLLKHSVDTMEQLARVILAVANGLIVVDPMVMDGLMAAAEARATFQEDLSLHELQRLLWMATNYRPGFHHS